MPMPGPTNSKEEKEWSSGNILDIKTIINHEEQDPAVEHKNQCQAILQQ